MRFLHFSYLANPGAGSLRPHELRDGDAFVEVSHALAKMGHDYGGLIVNHPTEQDGTDSSLRNVSGLSSRDFLVLTTRPPLNDRRTSTVRVVRRSGTALEYAIFDSLRKQLATCARDEIQLNHPDCLHLQFQNRADLSYYVKTNKTHPRFEASYHARETDLQRFARFDPNVTTAGYLLHSEPIDLPGGRKGPRLLVSFGVSGTIGLVFSYLLRTEPFPPFVGLLKQILKRPSLAIVEITLPDPTPVPRPFHDLRFSEKWKFVLLTK